MAALRRAGLERGCPELLGNPIKQPVRVSGGLRRAGTAHLAAGSHVCNPGLLQPKPCLTARADAGSSPPDPVRHFHRCALERSKLDSNWEVEKEHMTQRIFRRPEQNMDFQCCFCTQACACQSHKRPVTERL